MRSLFILSLIACLPLQAARNFVRASNQWIEHNTAVVVSEPLTISIWFRTDDLTVNQVALGVISGAGVAGRYLMVRGLTAGDPLSATAYDGTTSAQANSAAAVTTNTWHHGGATFSSLSARAIFLNGVKDTNTTTITSANAANTTRIGAFLSNNSNWSGQLAEGAIWNVVLTDDEMASLASGVSPLRIRPSALVFYVPMWSGAFDYVGRAALTDNNGTTDASDHPRRMR